MLGTLHLEPDYFLIKMENLRNTYTIKESDEIPSQDVVARHLYVEQVREYTYFVTGITKTFLECAEDKKDIHYHQFFKGQVICCIRVCPETTDNFLEAYMKLRRDHNARCRTITGYDAGQVAVHLEENGCQPQGYPTRQHRGCSSGQYRADIFNGGSRYEMSLHSVERTAIPAQLSLMLSVRGSRDNITTTYRQQSSGGCRY